MANVEEEAGELTSIEAAQRWLIQIAYDLGAGRLSANDASAALDAFQVWLEMYEEMEGS